MTDRLLGMYVHMHWAYNHPYAARTWSLEDWRAYLTGLHRLGYNLLQIWPMIDTMPVPLTASDRAHLEKLGEVIDIAHTLGMTVYVGASANTLGNAKAADYPFEDRPYFAVENRVNPGDADDVAALMAARRAFVEPLAQADGFWIIDSDPGGYPGSSPLEFAQLFQAHRVMLDDLRPGIALRYWMWEGWTDDFVYCPEWCDNPQACWRETLEHLSRMDLEPWGITACWKGHFQVIAELKLTNKTLFFPYGAIENEPSFPFTNWEPQRLEDAFALVSRDHYPVGVMANAQSHCLQLPHTYLFQHLAKGGAIDSADLTAFAEEILPGQGKVLAQAWTALGETNPRALSDGRAALSQISTERPRARGRYAGLCFNHVDQLVHDVESQAALKSAIVALREDVTGDGPLENLIRRLDTWFGRHGFADRYLGTFRDLLHPLLETMAANAAQGSALKEALAAFETGSPHGAFKRFLDRLRHDALSGK